MNETLKEINTAFGLISQIPVSHEYVEIMASAKAALRRAAAALNKEEDDGRSK